jgi:hypothetical protein
MDAVRLLGVSQSLIHTAERASVYLRVGPSPHGFSEMERSTNTKFWEELIAYFP